MNLNPMSICDLLSGVTVLLDLTPAPYFLRSALRSAVKPGPDPNLCGLAWCSSNLKEV